jgi:hypothetical protein
MSGDKPDQRLSLRSPSPIRLRVKGAILVDHVKSLDWQARKAAKIERSPVAVLDDVLARLSPLPGIRAAGRGYGLRLTRSAFTAAGN